MDKSQNIFGNYVGKKAYSSAVKSKAKYIQKYGDDSNTIYNLSLLDNKTIGKCLGVKNIVLSKVREELNIDKPLIIGNIRMGFGHYRISMAIASCANYLGYTPLWLDLNSFNLTTGGKIIEEQNKLYSLGSRLSQKYKLFNKYVWEPMNYEGFKKLSYNAKDQKNAELMTSIFKQIPKDIPYVATHAWPAQAAIHAGMEHVVNAIPDNWPMALHLSEGAIHTVQTPSAYLGYRTLKGMNNKAILNEIPSAAIKNVGHYIDHELVSNIEVDCKNRIERLNNNKPVRFMLTVGGAGAQREIFANIIKHLLPRVKSKEACIFINVGDYKNVWEELCNEIDGLSSFSIKHFDNFSETEAFAEFARNADINGIHVFYHKDIFEAVYSTNLLMRACDVLITKPSELAFYPVPKLFIQRVGKHEMWGAIRSAEIGDGTPECESIALALQMLDLFIKDKNIITNMCNNILKNKLQGVYNGAYEVVKLATGK